ncbi:MAG TPA: hypothetical protein VFG74_07550 [Miltoncostaeaceae bacterium]|nr:hypothetical protein [Miltoncostaeaceae bacterium]
MKGVGEVLDGRYRLERRLGDGVFQAEDLSLARRVVVRVSDREGAADLARLASLLRSVQFATSHVVPVLDEGMTDEGGRYVVSPLIDGTPVSELVRPGGRPIAADAAAAIGVALLEAAEAARRSVPEGAGAVPASAILDRDRELRVTRFILDGGRPRVCAAVGAVLHHLLTGREPEDGESVRARGYPVPDPLADVVDAALAGDLRTPAEMRRRLSAARRRMPLSG